MGYSVADIRQPSYSWNVTRGHDSFKELNSSIEAFDRAVRARPQPKEHEPGGQPRRPDQRFRWHTLRGPAAIAGLVLLAAMLYLGRGEPMKSQPPLGDPAAPAAVIDGTGAEPTQTTGEREQATGDATRTSAEADGPTESAASRTATGSETPDRDSVVATGTDAAAEDADADIDVTVNGSNRSVERDERDVETGTAALARQEGDYGIQVAAYDERSQARVLGDRLAAAGYPASVVEARLDQDQAVFRVRIGPYPDRRAAEAVGQRVQDEEALDWYVVMLR